MTTQNAWRFGVAVATLGTAAAAQADVYLAGTYQTGQPPFVQLLHYADNGTLINSGIGVPESVDALAVGYNGLVYGAANTLGYGSIAAFHGNTLAKVGELAGQTANGRYVYGIPQGLAVAPDGTLYATSSKFAALPDSVSGVLRFDMTAKRVDAAVIQRNVPANNLDVVGVAVGPDGQPYASVFGVGIVRPGETPAGEPFIPEGSAGLDAAASLTFGPDDNLYVVNYRNAGTPEYSIRRFDGDTGELIGTFVAGSNTPIREIAFTPTGDLLAVMGFGESIQRFDGSTGTPLGPFAIPANFRISAMAAGVVPEPAVGVAVLGLGVGLLRRRRS